MKNMQSFEQFIGGSSVNEANISAYKNMVQNVIKDVLGKQVKQSDINVGVKKQSGGYDLITLNGEPLCSSDSYVQMVRWATDAIKEDPAKYGLKESEMNEAADLSALDSLLAKNGWKESGNKSTAAHKGGNIRHFDYANTKNPNVMIRIVDSPSNGVYLELYKDDSQANPMDIKNAIRTPEDLIKGANKYVGVKLQESSVNEASVQVAGKSKPSGAKVLATVIVEHMMKENYLKPGAESVKNDLISDIADVIMNSTF